MRQILQDLCSVGAGILLFITGCAEHKRPDSTLNQAPLFIVIGGSSATVTSSQSLIAEIEITNISSVTVILDKLDCQMRSLFTHPIIPVSAEWTMTWRNNKYKAPVRLQSGEPFGLFFFSETLAPGEKLTAQIFGTILGCQQNEQVQFAIHYLQARGYAQSTLNVVTTVTCLY